MKNPDQLRRYLEGLGLRAAAVLGLVTIAWLSNFGEVRAQEPGGDLCKSALECSYADDWGIYVQNPTGVELDSSVIIQVGQDRAASEALVASLDALKLPGGGMYYSWDIDRKNVMVGGEIIPRDEFFRLMDASAGYMSEPTLETATVQEAPVIVASPTKQETVTEVENTTGDEVLVEKTMGALNTLAQSLIAIGGVLTVLTAIGVIRHRQSEQKIRSKEDAGKSLKKSANESKPVDLRSFLTKRHPITSSVAEPNMEVQDTQIVLYGRSAGVFGDESATKGKKEERIGGFEVTDRVVAGMCRREKGSHESYGKHNHSFSVNGNCMAPLIYKDTEYTLFGGTYIVVDKGFAPKVGDLVLIDYCKYRANTSSYVVGIYAGDTFGIPVLLSLYDTRGEERGGHGQITSFNYRFRDVNRTIVMGSVSKNLKEAEKIVDELEKEITANERFVINEVRW